MDTQEGNTIPEVWKAIPDWPGYEVSDQGRVRSYWKRPGYGGGHCFIGNTPAILKPSLRGRYLGVILSLYGKRAMVSVHRLVLSVFKGPCPPGMEACHNDGRHTNNFLDNLRWDSSSRNQLDKHTHGTFPNAKGEANPSAKLTEAEVLEIRRLAAQGHPQKALVKSFNSSPAVISNIINRKAWRHLP